MSESYKDYLAHVASEQSGMTHEQITEQMDKESEAIFDLNSFPAVNHSWVERGIKVSCEGANHPHHSHFLKQP